MPLATVMAMLWPVRKEKQVKLIFAKAAQRNNFDVWDAMAAMSSFSITIPNDQVEDIVFNLREIGCDVNVSSE